MDRRLSLPAFGRAPATYDPAYFYDMVRMLNSMTTSLNSPGAGRQSSLVVTALQQDDYALEPGEFFQVDGVVRVPVQSRPYVRGIYATGSIGTATVTIS